ncbi:hypothetical protein AAHC03_026922 [Spirometra sp. Aus1]
MGCRHRIAYLFLCLLHIIILIALALTLVGCENNFLKCKDNCKDFPSSLKGCKLNLNDDKGSISAGKILFLVGVVISVVAFVLILLNIYKCISIKKWKRSIKKRFRWILIVLLLMAVALIASFSQLKKENTTTKNSNFTKILSTLTTVIAVVEVFLVLFMLLASEAFVTTNGTNEDGMFTLAHPKFIFSFVLVGDYSGESPHFDVYNLTSAQFLNIRRKWSTTEILKAKMPFPFFAEAMN